MKNKVVAGLFLLVGIFFLGFNVSLAETTTYGDTTLTPTSNYVEGGLVPCGGPDNPCTLCHFVIGFQNLINFMLDLAVVVGLVGIFASGVLYILSAGDEKMMGSAKSALTATLIGFAIVLGAWLIVNVVLWTFSANLNMEAGGNWYTLECSTTSYSAPTTPTTPTTPIDPTNPADGKKIAEGENCGTSDYGDGVCVNGNVFTKCPGGGNYLMPDNCDSTMTDSLYCCVYPVGTAAPLLEGEKCGTDTWENTICKKDGVLFNKCPDGGIHTEPDNCEGGTHCCVYN